MEGLRGCLTCPRSHYGVVCVLAQYTMHNVAGLALILNHFQFVACFNFIVLYHVGNNENPQLVLMPFFTFYLKNI